MDIKEKWQSAWQYFNDWLLAKSTNSSIENIRLNRWIGTKYSPRCTRMTDAMKFKHVIQVDYKKWFNTANTRAWELSEDAKQYIGINKGFYIFERGVWLNGKFHINGLGDCDCVFVGTDSDEDALMIVMKFN
jgi:hypothetical protein